MTHPALGKVIILLLIALCISRPQIEEGTYPHKIEVSQLSQAELQLIPGIGKVYSKNILDYQGDDWTEVRGLGVKRAALLDEVLIKR